MILKASMSFVLVLHHGKVTVDGGEHEAGPVSLSPRKLKSKHDQCGAKIPSANSRAPGGYTDFPRDGVFLLARGLSFDGADFRAEGAAPGEGFWKLKGDRRVPRELQLSTQRAQRRR